jgi:hypothetical protein
MFDNPAGDVDPKPSICRSEGCQINYRTPLRTEPNANINWYSNRIRLIRLVNLDNRRAGWFGWGNNPASETGRCAVPLEFFFGY